MLKRKGISLSDAHKKKTWSSGTKKVKITPKYDTKLNCWGAISYHGASSLHIYQGTLKAQTHRDILEEHIEELNNVCPDGYQFQHDKHKSHVSVEPWAIRQGMEIVDYPTYSPDLSPIENLWATLKLAVASDNPTTENQLRNSLYRNWEKLTTPENLAPYFEGLENRYQNCLNLNGDYV